MVLLNNGTRVDIVEYMENSLSQNSNRTLAEMVLLSFGMSLYTILGVLGNGLVLMALITQRRWAGLDSVMLIFIFNLTSCDFLICLVTFPTTAISSAVDRWILGSGLCWVVAVCATYLRIAAILFMTMICIHRVIVIMYPFDDVISESRGKITCVFIWVFSSLPQIFPFFGYNPFFYDPIRALCIADLHTDNGAKFSVSTIAAVIYVAIPMLLITVIYSKILYIAISSRRKRLRNCRMNIGQVSSGRTNKPGSKAIITTLILVGSFILCFLPFLVITGINQATNSVTGGMIIWGEFSSSLHCVINPFIYFHTNRTFRKFLLRPFRGTVLEKTKLFSKYNTGQQTNLQISNANLTKLASATNLSAAYLSRPAGKSYSRPELNRPLSAPDDMRARLKKEEIKSKTSALVEILEHETDREPPPTESRNVGEVESSLKLMTSPSDVVTSPSPITRSFVQSTNSAATDHTLVSEASSNDYEELWELENGMFEIRMNTM